MEENLYKIKKETLEKKSNLLIGNEDIRKELENIITVSSKDREKEFSFLDISGNVLIHGRPGFGKTSIIYEQMLKAKNNGFETYHLNIASLISEKMGKTAKAIDEFFQKLIVESKKYKIILLIEEIEVFLPNRDGKDHDDMKRALTTFMHYMDNPINNLIIFCTTNHKDKLDKAILRRFSFIYEINIISTDMIVEFLNHDKNPFKDIGAEKEKKELSKLLCEKGVSFSDIKLIMRKVYLRNDFKLDYKSFKKEIENVN